MNVHAKSAKDRTLPSRIRNGLILFMTGLFVLIVGWRIEKLSYQAYIQDLELEATLQLIEIRESLEKEVFERILQLRELATRISLNPDITQAEFSAEARRFLRKNPDVINIAAAPDQVVKLVYPLSGNKGVVGLDYRDNAAQYPKVLEALRTGNGLVTGPVDLVQGGRGLILRQPVFYPATPLAGNKPDPWGILSTVLPYDRFVRSLNMREIGAKYDILIRELGVGGRSEQIFLGSPDVIDSSPVKLEFSFPFGVWELAAIPVEGWPEQRPEYFRQWLLRNATALLAVGLLWFVMRLAETRRIAETRLINGIEALDDGFVMFGPDGTLVLHNEKYAQMHKDNPAVKPGASYRDIVRESIMQGAVPEAVGREEEWLEGWDRLQLQGIVDIEQRLSDGRIIKTSDRRMEDGSIVGLRVDVSQFKQAQLAAESANKAKTDFMGVLSHELRTPMTVILGHVRMARHLDRLPVSKDLQTSMEAIPGAKDEIEPKLNKVYAHISQVMETMERSGNSLMILINEILDFAKIDAGGLSMSATQTDVDAIITPVIEQMRPIIEEKGLECVVEPTDAQLNADVQRVQQVLLNLIGNAAKFTDTGAIKLAVETTPDRVLFRVTDTGIGVPSSEIERVFEPFHQVDSTATRRYGGTGLGLAISRDIAEAHGGDLTLRSTVGEGSTFVLSLPRLTVANAAERPSRPATAVN